MGQRKKQVPDCRRFGLAAVLCMTCLAAQAGAYVDFFRAVNLDRPELVARLLSEGMDPNVRSEDGQPAIHKAFRDDSPLVVALLLKQNALDVNARNAVGETPLMLAAIKGNTEAMQVLLSRGAQVVQEGWTPLHYAASQGRLAPVELLLAREAPLDVRSPNGSTPLMMAARYGSEEVARLLLRRGADPSLVNEAGMNAAAFARGAGRDELAKELAKAAASRDMTEPLAPTR